MNEYFNVNTSSISVSVYEWQILNLVLATSSEIYKKMNVYFNINKAIGATFDELTSLKF